jgi:Iron-containing redox enzyme
VAGPNASLILRTKIGLARASVSAIYERFWDRGNAAELFPAIQVQTYDLARASIPLMEAALTRCKDVASSDAVATGLIEHLRAHIEEERNHDVWLLEDLQELGVSRDTVLARPPSMTAACLVGAQYYLINHDHPIALFGYMAALEGSVASEAFLEDFIARTGIRREGLRTLLLHARVDPQHAADLDDLIDRLPLASRHLAVLGMSAVSTVSLLAKLTEEVVDADEGRVPLGAELSRP